jgi:hypothetical protein
MSCIIAAAYGLILCIYMIFAIFGFKTFGRDTEPNIMECGYNPHNAYVIAARACLAATAILSIPVNHYPAREAVWDMIRDLAPQRYAGLTSMPQTLFMAETSLFWAGALGLGLGIQELSTLNDLMGLTVGVAVIFLLPGLFLCNFVTDESDRRPSAASSKFLLGAESSPGGKGSACRKHVVAGVAFLAVGLATTAMSAFSFIGNTWLGVAPPS